MSFKRLGAAAVATSLMFGTTGTTALNSTYSWTDWSSTTSRTRL